MICSTLASLWKFQYFQRPIYNPVEHLWWSLYCENSKPVSIFTKKLYRRCSLTRGMSEMITCIKLGKYQEPSVVNYFRKDLHVWLGSEYASVYFYIEKVLSMKLPLGQSNWFFVNETPVGNHSIAMEQSFHHFLLPREIHVPKKFSEANLPFIPPNIIISWVRSVSINACNW